MILIGDFTPSPQACKVRTVSGSSETNLPMKAVLSIVKFGGRASVTALLACRSRQPCHYPKW